MKTKRIKIEKGESVEIYLKRTERSQKLYSNIILSEDGHVNKEQRVVHNTGLRASLTLHGPATISFVRKKEEEMN